MQTFLKIWLQEEKWKYYTVFWNESFFNSSGAWVILSKINLIKWKQNNFQKSILIDFTEEFVSLNELCVKYKPAKSLLYCTKRLTHWYAFTTAIFCSIYINQRQLLLKKSISVYHESSWTHIYSNSPRLINKRN